MAIEACSRRVGMVMIVGANVVRAACLLGALLGAGAAKPAAAEDSSDQLHQRRADRLLVESAQRVSDGRKLQRDADTNFRRVEAGAAGAGSGLEAVGRGDGSGGAKAESGAESTAGAGRR
jgi:hypothetical protein